MSSNTILKPRGTVDYILDNGLLIDIMRDILLKEAKKYGFSYVELPIFENSNLFYRTVGESSDIVTKETFDLEKKGEMPYSLRPEFTASVSRMIVENKLYSSSNMPLKFTYFGPVFRYERPQKGRYRQITQFGVEILDDKIDLNSTLDAIVLSKKSAEQFLGEKINLKINFLGSKESRDNYKKQLYKYFSNKIDSMCDDCKIRLEKNPLRILDCKVEKDKIIAKGAPKIIDYLTNDDKNEFDLIKKSLNELSIDYEIDPQLVRGLDYYTGLVWELYIKDKEDIGSIGGGGKYSSLMSDIGGPNMSGIGFSLGGERLILSLSEKRKEQLLNLESDRLDYIIIDLGQDCFAYKISQLLHQKYNVSFTSKSRSLNGALKMADRINAKYAIIVNEDDIIVKNLKTRLQKTFSKGEFDCTLDEFISKINF